MPPDSVYLHRFSALKNKPSPRERRNIKINEKRITSRPSSQTECSQPNTTLSLSPNDRRRSRIPPPPLSTPSPPPVSPLPAATTTTRTPRAAKPPKRDRTRADRDRPVRRASVPVRPIGDSIAAKATLGAADSWWCWCVVGEMTGGSCCYPSSESVSMSTLCY